ncbi:hypothetical protein EIP91_006213 [Steccherinum ochraceum]|uniref:Methyltransferase ausD n=1 Tax=Steccherinum ochraceum TaxID=92696 RepID=A0A4R0R612_9APHY|nr:hypothetical protein EIP91_006213 [Steccherinum ochraceum]
MTEALAAPVILDARAAETARRAKLPLEERFYELEEDELEFFKQETKIQDADELTKHIRAVQAEAYLVHPYPCIRRFSFTKLKISRYPAYQDLLRLGRERKGSLFLDVGCCFGNDVRKAVHDGFPMDQAIASDLRPEYWDLGHKLFRTTPEEFPVPFLPGDIFDPNFLQIAPPATSAPTTSNPSLKDLRSLTPLNGRLSALHSSAFFHLFDEAQQFAVAKAFAGLLSPEPGSVIFGSHRGEAVPGVRSMDEPQKFNHSPESWTELWEKQIFEEGQVKVWAILREVARPDLDHVPGAKFYLLVWSVTRL